MTDNTLDPDLAAALRQFAGTLTSVQETNAEIAAALREFATAMSRVHNDAEALSDEMVRYREAFEAVDRRTWRAAFAGVAAVLILTIAVTVSVVVSRRNAEIVEAIRDCTQVGGRCYAEQSARGAQNVQSVIAVICDAVPPERRRPPCPPEPSPGPAPTPTTGGPP